ncbi:hypothetical protein C6496_01470 [Candidatus Poribacteria bacterium]|nr:MAG: hypothetical protein C6496_01470 [Candidatus Poribacteria bacterium]
MKQKRQPNKTLIPAKRVTNHLTGSETIHRCKPLPKNPNAAKKDIDIISLADSCLENNTKARE